MGGQPRPMMSIPSRPEALCVMLADLHHGLTERVRTLLQSMFEAVVMVPDTHSLVETARKIGPAVAIVDLSLEQVGSLDWLVHLRGDCPDLRILVVSVHDDAGAMRAALHAGADGFVLKRAIASEFVPAIEVLLTEGRHP